MTKNIRQNLNLDFSSLQKYKKTFPVGTRSNWLLLSVGTSILKSKERPKNCPKDVKRTSKSHLKEAHSFLKTLTLDYFHSCAHWICKIKLRCFHSCKQKLLVQGFYPARGGLGGYIFENIVFLRYHKNFDLGKQ